MTTALFSSPLPRAPRKWSKTGIKRQRVTKRTRRPYFTPEVKEACVVEYSTPWLKQAARRVNKGQPSLANHSSLLLRERRLHSGDP
jgi:hypothetical protein